MEETRSGINSDRQERKMNKHGDNQAESHFLTGIHKETSSSHTELFTLYNN